MGEEDIEILKELLKTLDNKNFTALRNILYYVETMEAEFARLEGIEDNASMLWIENNEKIEKMRPYKDVSPFDFGVLNGIDEACRIILGEKNGKQKK